MLEAVKRVGGDPPVRKGAGYNEVTRLPRGTLTLYVCRGISPAFFQSFFSKFCHTVYESEAPPMQPDFTLALNTNIRYNVRVREYALISKISIAKVSD